MKELDQYIPEKPKLEDFNMFFVNIVKDEELIHSGLIKKKADLDYRMDELLIEAMQKAGFDTVHVIEHQHATWDYFFTPEHQTHYPEEYAHPFRGEVIRYRDDEASKNHHNQWKFLGPSWTVYVHEQENKDAYDSALNNYRAEEEALIEAFKKDLFSETGLSKSPKKHAIWSKAASKYGYHNVQSLEKIRDFVKDVADLA